MSIPTRGLKSDEMAHSTVSNISHLLLIGIFGATFNATEMLRWIKSGKYRNEWPCQLSVFVAVYPFMRVSIYPKTELASNTLLLILNEFGTVLFELGAQRIRQTGNTIFTFAKPEQQTISHFSGQSPPPLTPPPPKKKKKKLKKYWKKKKKI